MRPKGKLFALFAVFAAIGLVTASGAFTTVQAERTATVNVEGDGSALLQLTPTSGPNSEYADSSGDALSIDLGTTTSGGGSGVNDEAVTKIDNIVNVTNQGTQEVTLTVSSYSASSPLNTGEGESAPNFYVYNNAASGTDLQDTTITLSPGEGTNVSVYVDTTGNALSSSDSIDVTVTLDASAT